MTAKKPAPRDREVRPLAYGVIIRAFTLPTSTLPMRLEVFVAITAFIFLAIVGGLIGIVLAGLPDSPIRRLVVNDIGPHLPWSALQRIGSDLREAPREFADLAAVEAHYRKILAPFGDLDAAEWRHLAEHSVERGPDRRCRTLFDPGIVRAFRPGLIYALSLWRYWDAIRCPVLLLRGERSDLLPERTAAEMARRGPRAEVVQIPGCGHAPALLDKDQIGIVVDWLARGRC
jgi:pimeloyl-ACP methyl ester carboxylesterase